MRTAVTLCGAVLLLTGLVTVVVHGQGLPTAPSSTPIATTSVVPPTVVNPPIQPGIAPTVIPTIDFRQIPANVLPRVDASGRSIPGSGYHANPDPKDYADTSPRAIAARAAQAHSTSTPVGTPTAAPVSGIGSPSSSGMH